jgi:cytochrome c553
MRRVFVPYRLAVVLATVGLCAQIACTKSTPPAVQPASSATVLQVMRGVLFPSSNVIFAAQSDDPEKIEKAEDPATATDPLKSTYGGWEAVMNAGLALSESTRLLAIPRACSNGKPAPIDHETWKKGLDELRAAGNAAYEAGKAKNQDQVLEAADKVVTACSTCHDAFREKNPRCTP